MEQNRKPRNSPTQFWPISLQQKGKYIQWRKDRHFNKCYWENGTTACKRMKLEHSLAPYANINSKWIEDLNIKLDTIKLLEETRQNTL